MSDLVEFLLARVAEDEEVARITMREMEAWPSADPGGSALFPGAGGDLQPCTTISPARVLAECEAVRRVVELAEEASGLDMMVDSDRRVGPRDMGADPYVGDRIIRALAQPYADHPGFRAEWRL